MIDTVDNILNIFLKEDLIELPPIIELKFASGVPKKFRYEEFCNYHRVPGHITRNCRMLRHIIQDFIDKIAIKMDDNTTMQDGILHPNNEHLGEFTNPLPPSQSRGYISKVSTSNELHYYFAHKRGCRHESPNKIINRANTNAASSMHNYSYDANNMNNAKSKVPLFVPTSAKCI